MPRNGSGTYSLPEPPFVAGTVISSATVNDDLNDIATALTGSLPRDGQAGMLGQFKAVDGSIALPSISFNTDADSGFFLSAAGVIGIVIGGVQVGTINSGGVAGTLPIGIMSSYGGSTAPSGWLLCYGQNVSRTTYALLFAAIGTAFGSGDGLTTFGLPDLRGKADVGLDNMGGVAAGNLTSTYFGASPTTLGTSGGIQFKTLLTANLPAYTPSGSVGISDPGHVHTYQLAINSNQKPNSAGSTPFESYLTQNTSSSTTGITASFSGNAQGGSSTAFGLVQPSMVVNKIIYAGA